MSGFALHWSAGTTPLGAVARDGVVAALSRLATTRVREAQVPEARAFHAHFDSAGGAETGFPICTDDWVVCGSLRLDDRQRLRAILRDAGEEPAATAADADLLLASLRAWGAGAASRLRGDFAFAALDRRERRLVVARSAFGLRPLFVAREGTGLIVASDVATLRAALRSDPPLERGTLHEFLREGLVVHPTASYWQGVERVPAAAQWSWDDRGRRTEARIWEFPVPGMMRGLTDEDVASGFREVLGQAVLDRVRGPRAGLLLSGGLDSTAIAAALMRQRPGTILSALTVASDPVISADEPAWAASAAEALGIPLHTMREREESTLKHVGSPGVITDEPIDEPELLSRRAQVAWLAERAPLSLCGEDGDALLAPPPLRAVVRAMGWRDTVVAWRDYRAAHGTRPWIGLRDLRWARAWRLALSNRRPSWLRGASRHTASDGREHPTHPNAARAFERPTWDAFVGTLQPDVIGVRHDFSLPLLDERVIAFVFALAPIPWCQRKWLLRRANRGVLPQALLDRPKTVVRGYDESLIARWRARGGVSTRLPAPVDEWVDEPRWRSVLAEGDVSEVRAAWRVFALSHWLAQPGVS